MQTPPCDAHTSCDARPAKFVGTYIGNPLAESLDASADSIDGIFGNWKSGLRRSQMFIARQDDCFLRSGRSATKETFRSYGAEF